MRTRNKTKAKPTERTASEWEGYKFGLVVTDRTHLAGEFKKQLRDAAPATAFALIWTRIDPVSENNHILDQLQRALSRYEWGMTLTMAPDGATATIEPTFFLKDKEPA